MFPVERWCIDFEELLLVTFVSGASAMISPIVEMIRPGFCISYGTVQAKLRGLHLTTAFFEANNHKRPGS